jgi:hypothetical protein
MTTKTEALSYHTRLRAMPEERDILARVQASFAAVGVEVSLNDVIRHAIRAMEIPRPADEAEAHSAWIEHHMGCDDCQGHRTPQCPDGVLIRREYQRHLGLRDGRSYALQPVVSASPLNERHSA